MTSEIRANTLKNRVGLGTISFTNTGAIVSGIVTANSFSGPISGTTGTFSGNVDINGDLDVDGHTNLDNVSIAGVTTFASDINTQRISVASGNIITLPDGGRESNEAHIRLGNDGDFRMYHEAGAHTTLENHSSSSDLILMTSSAARNILFKTNGNNERFRIASNGQIATRGAQGTSFNNAGTGSFGSFLTINGGHTSNQWGILSLEGNTSANGYAVGAIQFINQNNANGSSGANNQSRLLAKIDVSSVTSDSNAGDDSGGALQFFTKPEAGQPAQRLTITSTGQFKVGNNPTAASGTFTHIEAPSGFNSGETIVQIVGDSTTTGPRLNLQNRNTGASASSEILGSDSGGQSTTAIRFYHTDQSNNYGEIAFATRNQSGLPPEDRLRISKDGELFVGDGLGSANRSTLLSISGAYQEATGAWAQLGIYSSDSYAQNKGGSLVFGGNAGSGQSRTYFAGIAGVKENSTSGNYAGVMKFYTRPSGSTPEERMRLHSAGGLSVGTSPSSMYVSDAKLFVENTIGNVAVFSHSGSGNNYPIIVRNNRSNGGTAGYMIIFLAAGGTEVGSVQSNGSGTSFNTASDYRLKENAVSISDGITRVKNLKPYQFEWKSDLGTKVDGFFAHEAQTVVPESVVGTKDEVDSDGKPKYQGIDQAKLVPVLTAALQEVITKIEKLEQDNIALRARVTNLEGS